MTRRNLPARSLVLEMVAQEAAKVGADPGLLFSRSRRAELVWVRWRVWHRLRALAYSYPAIGFHFGVDHSAVFHALAKPMPEQPVTPSDVALSTRERREGRAMRRARLVEMAKAWTPPAKAAGSAFAPIPQARLMGRRA